MDPSGALADLTAADALFTAIGEVANQAAVQVMIGTALDTLGDSRAAWKYFHLGLLAAHASGELSPLYGAYGEITVAAAHLGHAQAALLFAHEYVQQARPIGPPPVRIGSLLLRASCFVALHDGAAASVDVREARALVDRLVDPGQRESILGDLLFVSGRASRLDSAPGALRALDEAVTIYSHTDYHFLLAALLEERARARLALGDEPRAEADLAAAIGERERQRARIRDAERRIDFFERDRSVFEEMIDLQVRRRHRADMAFEYAERGRARALLDAALGAGSTTASGGEPVSARNLSSHLPVGVTLIEYQIQMGRVLAWCVHRGSGITLHQLAASPLVLARDVQELRRALSDGSVPALAASASRLYETLLTPLLPCLAAGNHLVFVPDGALHELPFPLLREPRTGRFLIESHVVSVAPSAALYMHALDRDRRLSRLGPGTALAVLDPAFDREVFPELPRLPAAKAESEAVARLGLPVMTLAGATATRDRFFDLAPRATVVHFGGHALVNEANGMLSELTLAPGSTTDDSGVLYARDLWNRRFGRTRLVALAACGALRGHELVGEGVVSLARAFLAAGVPTVVASVAAIPDLQAHAFFDRFYAHLAAGEDGPTALQGAQLECLRAADPDLRRPDLWGQFEVIGASVGSPLRSARLTR
jgi:CHAT domain-containing protein